MTLNRVQIFVVYYKLFASSYHCLCFNVECSYSAVKGLTTFFDIVSYFFLGNTYSTSDMHFNDDDNFWIDDMTVEPTSESVYDSHFNDTCVSLYYISLLT